MTIFVEVVFATVLTAFVGVTVYAFASGQIQLHGLLLDKQLGGLSQVRVQLLTVTVSIAAIYLSETISAVRAGSISLPDIPESLILGAYASHGIYIAGKGASLVRMLLQILRGSAK